MSDAQDKAWVDEHHDVVSEAFRLFVDTGEWPTVKDLKRHFAQRGRVLDVQEIANSKPRFIGEVRAVHQEAFVLRFRQLRIA